MKLQDALYVAIDWCAKNKVTISDNLSDELAALGIAIKANLITRDRRELGRIQKGKMDARLAAIIKRHFRRQAELIKQRLDMYFPGRKQNLGDMLLDDLGDDEEFIAELLQILVLGGKGGVSLFGERITISMDFTTANAGVLKWVRQYAGDLVKSLDNATIDLLRQAIASFVEMPGMTIGDIVGMLPFGDERAWRIAVTEITRAYAHGQQLGAMQLAEEFPGVQVMKQWFTNMDDRTCDLCSPLNGVEVEQDEDFYEAEDEYADGNPPRHVSCRCFLDYTTRLE